MPRGPGRPKKHVGLSWDDEPLVRNMPATNALSQGSLLSPSPEESPRQVGTVRLFDSSPGKHGKRTQSANQQEAVPHAPGRSDSDLNLTALLKKILREVAPAEFQDTTAPMTNSEVLARRLVIKALEGNQYAMQEVLDRSEGKPVRALQVSAPDTALEDQIDRASVDALNKLAEGSDEVSP